MIKIKMVDKSYFELYDKIPMNVDVRSEFQLRRIDGGLGGIAFDEVPVTPYVKDLAKFERATEYEKEFDISTWLFFMAFDDDKPVGALTLAGPTPNLYMIVGMKEACVLWDIRVDDKYKHHGIGQKLFDQAKYAAQEKGYKKMIIESQNNNVTACRFYRKQGAVISKIDTNAYASEPGLENEIQFIWTLDLA
jgi:ribosomal protein S18 acetylase RimI-like enzyme